MFYQFCDNCKILSCTFYLKEDEMKIAMFTHFKEYHRDHKIFKISKNFIAVEKDSHVFIVQCYEPSTQ